MTTCIPVAGGVPGLPGPPPLLNPGNNPFRDPRWRGAMAQGFPFQPGAGVGEHVAFRALYDTSGANKVLYLSWLVQVDAALSNAEDRLYVGLRGGGTDDDSMVIEITPYTGGVPITNGPTGGCRGLQAQRRRYLATRRGARLDREQHPRLAGDESGALGDSDAHSGADHRRRPQH